MRRLRVVRLWPGSTLRAAATTRSRTCRCNARLAHGLKRKRIRRWRPTAIEYGLDAAVRERELDDARTVTDPSHSAGDRAEQRMGSTAVPCETVIVVTVGHAAG